MAPRSASCLVLLTLSVCCPGCQTQQLLAPRADLERRYLSHLEWLTRKSDVARVALASHPTLNFSVFDGEVIRWIDDPEHLAAFSLALADGTFEPHEGL